MCAYLFFILFFSVLTFALVFSSSNCPRWVFLGLRRICLFQYHQFFLFCFVFWEVGGNPKPTSSHLPPSPPSHIHFPFPSPLQHGSVGGGAGSSVPCGLHLSASIATLAFCSAPVCGFTPVGQAGQGCVGGCPWVQSPCGGCGTLGTFDETPQPPTWWGGGEVAMAAAMGLPPLPLLKLSEAFSRENIVNASGKLGGVAGVLAGVHIWGWRGKKHNNNQCRSPKQEYTHPHRAVVVY